MKRSHEFSSQRKAVANAAKNLSLTLEQFFFVAAKAQAPDLSRKQVKEQLERYSSDARQPPQFVLKFLAMQTSSASSTASRKLDPERRATVRPPVSVALPAYA